MLGAFLSAAGLCCCGCGAGLAQMAHAERIDEPEAARCFGWGAIWLTITGVGFHIWSKGIA